MTSFSEDKRKELIKNIHYGFIKKLRSAKQLLDFDKEISAGLYTYALEEFGKLLLVKESKLINNKYEINDNNFRNHKKKFTKALDYLQENNHQKCYVLNDEGGFSSDSFSWKGFDIGLLANLEARLSIFYSDFKRKNKNNVEVVKVPNVSRDMLSDAINELENVVAILSQN